MRSLVIKLFKRVILRWIDPQTVVDKSARSSNPYLMILIVGPLVLRRLVKRFDARHQDKPVRLKLKAGEEFQIRTISRELLKRRD